jgi:hypothetical protein
MNWTSLLIGCAFVAYGIGSIPARLRDPAGAGKLGAMQENLGQKAGLWAHVCFYTIVPILLGLLGISLGVMGISFW